MSRTSARWQWLDTVVDGAELGSCPAPRCACEAHGRTRVALANKVRWRSAGTSVAQTGTSPGRTLFFLNKPSMPLVRPLTASSFCFIMPPRSSFTSPTVMPYLLEFLISCHKCEECKSACRAQVLSIRVGQSSSWSWHCPELWPLLRPKMQLCVCEHLHGRHDIPVAGVLPVVPSEITMKHRFGKHTHLHVFLGVVQVPRAWYTETLFAAPTLEGMQPTLRQVPPRRPLPSMQVTFSPSWPALMAPT